MYGSPYMYMDCVIVAMYLNKMTKVIETILMRTSIFLLVQIIRYNFQLLFS